ncbi:MAG: hypothetical protein BWY45_03160 [Euryarchaeota archaeon ADurb.Bin294]|nr:MAG: hypothetical protein BWY45_03160 [Euryarchaeota archaeon ADurb.Bin294]
MKGDGSSLNTSRLNIRAERIATAIPRTYRKNITFPAAAPKNTPAKSTYTGSRAVQDMNGMVMMVIILSALLCRVLVAMIAGTLHPNPIRNGMNERPCRPTECISRSMTNAALARYPVSSRMESSRNRTNMLGTKTRTDPTPPITPSDRNDLTNGSISTPFIRSVKYPNMYSIPTRNGLEALKVSWNANHIHERKMGIPNNRCVRTWSIRSPGMTLPMVHLTEQVVISSDVLYLASRISSAIPSRSAESLVSMNGMVSPFSCSIFSRCSSPSISRIAA